MTLRHRTLAARRARLPWLLALAALGLRCQVPFVVGQRDSNASGAGGAPSEIQGGEAHGAGATSDEGGASPGGVSSGGAAVGGASGGRPSTGGSTGSGGVAGTGGAPLEPCEKPLRALQVSAGEHHACAVEADSGQLYCWGLGLSGQLGNGDTQSSARPVLVQSQERFLEVQALGFATCALSETQGLYCFGNNFDGVLADGTDQGQSVPVLTASDVSVFAASSSYVLALSDTQGLLAWGANTHGQLGMGNDRLGATIRIETPVNIELRGLSAGYTHACAIDAAQRAVCAGNNADSQLGIAGASRSTFTVVDELLPFKLLTAGYDRTCGMTTAGTLSCWGKNEPVTFSEQPAVLTTPTRVSPSAAWTWLSVGFAHWCAIDNTTRLVCAGENVHGELGTAEATSSGDFVEPFPGVHFRDVSAGRGFTCAGRADDGAVLCFGSNENGKLGRGSTDESERAPGFVCLP